MCSLVSSAAQLQKALWRNCRNQCRKPLQKIWRLVKSGMKEWLSRASSAWRLVALWAALPTFPATGASRFQKTMTFLTLRRLNWPIKKLWLEHCRKRHRKNLIFSRVLTLPKAQSLPNLALRFNGRFGNDVEQPQRQRQRQPKFQTANFWFRFSRQ